MNYTNIGRKNCVSSAGAERLLPRPSDDYAMVVFAAGGVLERDDGRRCVLHRPRYDDWVLPKGTVEPGESLVETALREVTEEAQCDVALGPVAGRLQYDVAAGPKVVVFWRMSLVRERPFRANAEVDERTWFAPADACDRLTYDNERELLRRTLDER
ncbi:8-oxo-dGTP diphosphatase [Halogeometricum rufum]|uniref:8-oxo-dGTP diphosphatase n=2 Tax=Halogeometricum rufum TaxID=553469 RepID=A0A1I6FWH9_9EURY|nr:8-oxo-dGTP diphosphatase [Halogeometricum rufum]